MTTYATYFLNVQPGTTYIEEDFTLTTTGDLSDNNLTTDELGNGWAAGSPLNFTYNASGEGAEVTVTTNTGTTVETNGREDVTVEATFVIKRGTADARWQGVTVRGTGGTADGLSIGFNGTGADPNIVLTDGNLADTPLTTWDLSVLCTTPPVDGDTVDMFVSCVGDTITLESLAVNGGAIQVIGSSYVLTGATATAHGAGSGAYWYGIATNEREVTTAERFKYFRVRDAVGSTYGGRLVRISDNGILDGTTFSATEGAHYLVSGLGGFASGQDGFVAEKNLIETNDVSWVSLQGDVITDDTMRFQIVSGRVSYVDAGETITYNLPTRTLVTAKASTAYREFTGPRWTRCTCGTLIRDVADAAAAASDNLLFEFEVTNERYIDYDPDATGGGSAVAIRNLQILVGDAPSPTPTLSGTLPADTVYPTVTYTPTSTDDPVRGMYVEYVKNPGANEVVEETRLVLPSTDSLTFSATKLPEPGAVYEARVTGIYDHFGDIPVTHEETVALDVPGSITDPDTPTVAATVGTGLWDFSIDRPRSRWQYRIKDLDDATVDPYGWVDINELDGDDQQSALSSFAWPGLRNTRVEFRHWYPLTNHTFAEEDFTATTTGTLTTNNLTVDEVGNGWTGGSPGSFSYGASNEGVECTATSEQSATIETNGREDVQVECTIKLHRGSTDDEWQGIVLRGTSSTAGSGLTAAFSGIFVDPNLVLRDGGAGGTILHTWDISTLVPVDSYPISGDTVEVVMQCEGDNITFYSLKRNNGPVEIINDTHTLTGAAKTAHGAGTGADWYGILSNDLVASSAERFESFKVGAIPPYSYVSPITEIAAATATSPAGQQWTLIDPDVPSGGGQVLFDVLAYDQIRSATTEVQATRGGNAVLPGRLREPVFNITFEITSTEQREQFFDVLEAERLALMTPHGETFPVIPIADVVLTHPQNLRHGQGQSRGQGNAADTDYYALAACTFARDTRWQI